MSIRAADHTEKSKLYPSGIAHPFQNAIWTAIIIVAIITLAGITGWIAGIPWLRSMGQSLETMRVITVICFALTSPALAIILTKRPAGFKIIVPVICGIFLIIVSLMSAYAWLYLSETKHEVSISATPVLRLFLASGTRMALITSFIFLITGIALILLARDNQVASNAAHIIFIPAVIASYIVPVSYLLNVFSVHTFLNTAVALNTGIAFCAVSVAVYLLRPDTWLMSVFTSKSSGGLMARRLFPWLVLLPILIAWLRIHGENSGFFISEVGVLLVAVTYTFLFILLIWITARSVNIIDRKRQVADRALKESYEEMESRVRERTAELSDLNILLDGEIKERIKAESKLVILNSELENRVAERTNEISLANERLKILSETSRRLLVSGNPVELVDSLCSSVMRFLDCHVFFNFLVDDAKGKLNLNAYSGIPVEEARKIEWLDFGSGVCGCVARSGTRMVEENISTTSRPETNLVRSFGILAYACHPLLSQDKVIGTLSFGSRSRTTFSEEDLSLMKSFTDQVAIAMVRIRNEDFLRRSEERYRSLMELSPGASFVNRNNRIVLVNSAARKLLAAGSNEEILGKSPFDIFHPDCHDLVRKRIDKINKGETVPPAIERIVRTDGVIRDVEVVASEIVDSEGSAIQVIMSDITERKKAEKELSDTKNYLENLINYANAPIIVWDHENMIRLFNHAFEHLTGYNSSEVEGKSLDLLFPKDSLNESMKKIRDAVTENWETIEIPILTKNNDKRTVLWNSARIFDNSRISYSTIAQGNDITDRIKAERALKESKVKLEIALENGKIGIWEWEISTGIFKWDERMERMFGYKPGSLESRFEAFERCIHEEDLHHVRSAFNRSLAENIPLNTVYRIKLKNDNVSYISTKALLEKDKNGIPVKMAGVCFDITEMKRGAEKALFMLNEELIRSNKELEQFAYVASHDLQEPLRMVSSFTQLLSQRYGDKLDQDAREFIRFAVDGAIRMQVLINDLLDYSRIESKAKKYTSIDMHHILGQVVVSLKVKIQEKNALITNDEMPLVMADGGQMVQLFQNLIGNALKFCESAPIIHISATEENERYLFSVRDNGIGIEPEYYNKIFQIFQRLHSKEEYGGTGIGLAICKRIIDRHGGKIWVKSNPGKGSEFFFTLLKS